VRIVVPKGKTAEAKYPAEVTAPILNGLRNISASLSVRKSRQVAIPNTAGFGAMENVGMLLTIRPLSWRIPKSIRSDGAKPTQRCRARLAHQWFEIW